MDIELLRANAEELGVTDLLEKALQECGWGNQ